MTRIRRHRPARNRSQNTAATRTMYRVANAHARYTRPPNASDKRSNADPGVASTTRYDGTTMTGMASPSDTQVMNRVSPAPRSAPAYTMLAASAKEYTATNFSSNGMSAAVASHAATSSGAAALKSGRDGAISKAGRPTNTAAATSMYPVVHRTPSRADRAAKSGRSSPNR